MRLLAEKYKLDSRPIAESCGCPACKSYSRAYIRHLLKADERLGMRLCVLHNLWFYNELTANMRSSIETADLRSSIINTAAYSDNLRRIKRNE